MQPISILRVPSVQPEPAWPVGWQSGTRLASVCMQMTCSLQIHIKGWDRGCHQILF